MSQELISKYIKGGLKEKIDALFDKYDTKRATLLEVLRMAMEEYGHITLEMEEAIAAYLEIASIDVREVMTFYTLYYTKERAKNRFNVCRTLSCQLMGGGEIIQYLEEKLGIKAGQQSEDGKFSIEAVECLGACEIAPMMQVNDGKYEGCLTKKKIDELIAAAKA